MYPTEMRDAVCSKCLCANLFTTGLQVQNTFHYIASRKKFDEKITLQFLYDISHQSNTSTDRIVIFLALPYIKVFIVGITVNQSWPQ